MRASVRICRPRPVAHPSRSDSPPTGPACHPRATRRPDAQRSGPKCFGIDPLDQQPAIPLSFYHNRCSATATKPVLDNITKGPQYSCEPSCQPLAAKARSIAAQVSSRRPQLGRCQHRWKPAAPAQIAVRPPCASASAFPRKQRKAPRAHSSAISCERLRTTTTLR